MLVTAALTSPWTSACAFIRLVWAALFWRSTSLMMLFSEATTSFLSRVAAWSALISWATIHVTQALTFAQRRNCQTIFPFRKQTSQGEGSRQTDSTLGL